MQAGVDAFDDAAEGGEGFGEELGDSILRTVVAVQVGQQFLSDGRGLFKQGFSLATQSIRFKFNRFFLDHRLQS